MASIHPISGRLTSIPASVKGVSVGAQGMLTKALNKVLESFDEREVVVGAIELLRNDLAGKQAALLEMVNEIRHTAGLAPVGVAGEPMAMEPAKRGRSAS